jgi:acyl-CoA dehydrogenase
MTWLLLLALLGISMGCAFYGTSLLIWSIAMATGFIILAATGAVPIFSLFVIGLILAAITLSLNVTPWRQMLISGPFLKQFRRMLPEISETEQVALDAGTVGWEGELFAGRPSWKILKKQPYLGLTVEEQAFLDGPVEEICHQLNSWEITHIDADLNPETWAFLKENRFFVRRPWIFCHGSPGRIAKTLLGMRRHRFDRSRSEFARTR